MGRHGSSIEANEAFEALRDELMADPDVETAVWFGLPAAKVSGKIFAAIFESALIVKLEPEEIEQLVVDGGGEMFDPSGKQRPMHGWLHSNTEHQEWHALAADALAYVRSAL